MLFRSLATLRIDRTLLGQVDELNWRGARPDFEDTCRYLREGSLPARMAALASARNA